MTIWHSPVDLIELNTLCIGTAVAHLGIEFIDFGL
jgi:hypothetical protein